MKKIALLSASLALASLLAAAPVHALNLRSWVASNGDDTNDCSRATPCATFSGAFGKTIAAGAILCADNGNYGGFTVTKSITISCDAVGSNTSELTGVTGLNINVAASDRVVLRGFEISMQSGPSIVFQGAGTLVLERMRLDKNTSAATSVLAFTPNGPAKLVVSDSDIVGGGDGTVGAGILVQPQAGGSARVVLERVNVSAATFGIAADGTGSTAGINMTITDSMVGGSSQYGIVAVTPGGNAPVGVMVKNTKSLNNTVGIGSFGPNVTVRVDGSSVIGNGTGLTFSGGGALLTYGNNNVDANGANGAFSGSVGLQ